MSEFKCGTSTCFVRVTPYECASLWRSLWEKQLWLEPATQICVWGKPRLLLQTCDFTCPVEDKKASTGIFGNVSVRKGFQLQVKLQMQKAQRIRAFAVHPQRSASYCLATADDSLLTSDPGIEGDAHTAVGVVGLHGNFPCATGAVTETEGGKGVSRTLRPNVQALQFSFFTCRPERPHPPPHSHPPELCLDSKLPRVNTEVKAGMEKPGKALFRDHLIRNAYCHPQYCHIYQPFCKPLWWF